MPSPGDLIEIFRIGYQHWAVYVGDGYVVHLVNLDSSSSFSSSSSETNSTGRKGKIKKQKLDTVVGRDRWRVNNKFDSEHKPRPAQEIVDEALSMVGDDVDYSVIKWNCENFATKRRYGKSECAQVEDGATAIMSTVAAAAGVVAGPVGVAVGAVAGALYMKGSLALVKKLFS
ncbi:hypothetical protein INR49_024519 [Caranx melampygus]|nr:hypothetical protein INR49_024519 [Caranx melampygus]